MHENDIILPQRIAPAPSQRSNPVLLIILLNTVCLCHKISKQTKKGEITENWVCCPRTTSCHRRLSPYLLAALLLTKGSPQQVTAHFSFLADCFKYKILYLM